MADRRATPAGPDKMLAWMRRVDADLAMLKRRKVQGDLTLENAATNGDLAVGGGLDVSGQTFLDMLAAAPMVLRGSKTFTTDIEKLGSDDAARSHAIVTRDQNGVILDIWPRPWVFVGGTASQSIATGVRTVVTTINVSYSVPFTQDQTYDAASSSIIVPVFGAWRHYHFGAWAAVADATVRALVPQLSTDGGSTWADHYNTIVTANNNASDTVPMMLIGEQNYNIGSRFRQTVYHRSVTTPIAYTPSRFILEWVRGSPTL